MRLDFSEIGYPRALLAALTVLLAVAAIVAASTSTAAFGVYNSAWDGASALQTEADAVGTESEIVLNTSAYGDVPANGTVAVVLSPETRYEREDSERLRTFVQNGGTLVVADDYGRHGDALLADIDADARFDGRPLRDERHNYRSPNMPVATNVSNDPNASIVEGVDQLTLNYGTAVRPNGATVRATTSGFAYFDENQNGELDANESLDEHPIVTVESVGEGRVIVVGDPSLFINAMLDRPGNQAFVRAIFDGHERAILDYSHSGRQPPLAVALLLVRGSPVLQVLVGAVGLGAVVGWAERPGLLGRLRRGDAREEVRTDAARRDELAAYLRRQHPDWDDRRVDRVIAGVLSEENNSDGNG
ncbi:DUF4350 domain-containing protein [Halegenticoccus tardaugens]|uniref:DUF4350 domain-containing protein n=1 Tax=Halegenticoccus tardaugens TaxID=2071624 RepID=UPI00100A9ED4|nr:DUF4350 domain-containing protein [Halegenticoccus tardaugens]